MPTSSSRFYSPFALLLIAASLGSAALSTSAAAFEIDPTCAFSDRYPVEITVPGAEAARTVVGTGIDVDRVALPGGPYQSGIVTAYVDDGERARLEALGLAVTPIRNEAKEMFLRVQSEWAARAGQAIEPTLAVWPTYPEFEAELQAVAAAHPNIARLVQIGTSVQGRAIWMLRLSDNPDAQEAEPEFKFTSSIHGDEVTGMELSRRMIHYLVDNYGVDPVCTALVDDNELWFCPMHNPDGYVNGTRYNAHGYDLNRTFPDPVTDPHDDPTGREPEVQCFMYFGYAHNFILSANYHGGSLVMNIPWDCRLAETPDHDLLWAISEGYASRNAPMWNSTEFEHGITLGSEWYIIHGGMQDWCYQWRNEMDITIEISYTKWPTMAQMDTYWAQNRESMLNYMQATARGVHGRVTDLATGAPISAQVDVREVGKVIRTDPDVGDFHRMLLPGSYTITFTALGYQPKTVNGVSVVGLASTWLDVQLQSTSVGMDEPPIETVDELTIEKITPNPSSSEVTLEIRTDVTRAVSLSVFDASGRKVRSLFAGEVAGRASVLWDGCDGQGAPCSSGIYWLRASDGEHNRAERIVLTH